MHIRAIPEGIVVFIYDKNKDVLLISDCCEWGIAL